MGRSRRFVPLALLIALCAATGVLRIAHDLTAHICSCVSGLVLVEECAAHRGHACHGSDTGESRQGETHNHRRPAGEDDCDLCAVLHAARQAIAAAEAPALIGPDGLIGEVVSRPLGRVAGTGGLPWSARGPPMIS